MVILGIDPGVATVGFGLVSCVGTRMKALEYGVITTPAHTLLEDRLCSVYDDMCSIISRHRPDCVSIEELFFNRNITTAIDVAQARGVLLLACRKAGLDVYEYTPLQVKSSLVGYGRAEKQQVQYMVRLLLNLTETPKPDDAADALALAICHGRCAAGFNGGR